MSYLHLKEKTKINDDKEQWLEQEKGQGDGGEV